MTTWNTTAATVVVQFVQLDVYFDVVCPWCYVGERRLAAAIDGLDADGKCIDLRWRAFQLDPRATSEPGDLRARVDAKYGPGAFDSMTRRLTELGGSEGIDFRFDTTLRVGTLDAHRLVQWAQLNDPATTTAVVAALFKAYFTDGANVADHGVLCGVARAVGLDGEAAGEMLGSGQLTDRVHADQQAAVRAGVTGVPAVLYNGATVIPGAQDVDTITRVLTRLLAKVS